MKGIAILLSLMTLVAVSEQKAVRRKKLHIVPLGPQTCIPAFCGSRNIIYHLYAGLTNSLMSEMGLDCNIEFTSKWARKKLLRTASRNLKRVKKARIDAKSIKDPDERRFLLMFMKRLLPVSKDFKKIVKLTPIAAEPQDEMVPLAKLDSEDARARDRYVNIPPDEFMKQLESIIMSYSYETN